MNKFLSSLFFLFLINSSLFAEECAIMLGDEIDPEEFSESTGKKIYFCCGSCVKAFDSAAAYYIKAVPALAEKYTEAEKKKLGVDKVKLLDQKVCPIYPERYINPNSKTVEYKGRLFTFGHPVHNAVGNVTLMHTSKKLSTKDTFHSSRANCIYISYKKPRSQNVRGFL